MFQDPYTSLNPALTVLDILTEPLLISGTARAHAERRVRDLLGQVHLPPDSDRRCPANSPADSVSVSRSPAPCSRSAAHRLRRARQRIRPVDAVTPARPVRRDPGAHGGLVSVRHPRPLGRALHQPPGRGHAPGRIVESGDARTVITRRSMPTRRRCCSPRRSRSDPPGRATRGTPGVPRRPRRGTGRIVAAY